MDEKGKLRVSPFAVEAGVWRERPANIRLVDVAEERHGAARSRYGRGSLYMLVEGDREGGLPAPLSEQIMATIEDTYYQVSGSITRGLREALLAANKFLFERNMSADSEDRFSLGFNCAVIRENEVYLGQVGPALAAHVHQGQITCYPADSAWLRSMSPSAHDLLREPPAGLRRDVEPNLYHFSLNPGDTLILSTTALAGMARPGNLVEMVMQRDDPSARSALVALGAGRDLSAVVIDFPGRRPLADHNDQRPASVAPRAAGPAALPVLPMAPVQDAAPPPASALRPPFTASGPIPVTPPAPTTSDVRRSTMQDDQDTWAENAPSSRRKRAPREGLGQQAQRTRENARDFLLRTLPDKLPEPPPQQPGPSGRAISLGARALVIVAMLIPLVMVFLVVMTRIQYERTRRAQFDELLVTAQARYDAANKMENQATMRQELYQALAIVDEGISISPNDEALNALRRQIQHKLDQLNTVERVYHFWQLLQLDEDPVSATDSSRLVIQGVNVFLLNHGSDRVYKYLLNNAGDALQPVEGNPVLLQKGAMVGGVKVSDLVDIAWLEAGGGGQRTLSTFVILDRGGTLYAYDPQQGIDALPVADSDRWLKPQAIGGYFGNLYVLDPLFGSILKYVPTDNAYTTPPASYLNTNVNVDLTGAVDMAVDGNMYVLFADGKILKFYQGDQQPFSMDGLPTPMRSPTGIFVSGPQKPDGQGYVYVADTGNERILQFDKAGKYIRQFQALVDETQLKNLRGIYVDEEKRRLFVLSGRTLWLTELPALQK